MKIFILFCLIAAVSCDCHTKLRDTHYLVVDSQMNDGTQHDCINNMLKANNDINEIEFNVGDTEGATKSNTNYEWMMDMFKTFNSEHIYRLTVNLHNVHVDGDVHGDIKMDYLRALRFNLMTDDDTDTAQNMLNVLQVPHLVSFEIYCEGEKEINNGFKFAATYSNNLKYVRLNSEFSDFQSDYDRFVLTFKDKNDVPNDDQFGYIKQIREHQDNKGHNLREVIIWCGTDFHKFDFIFVKDNTNLRRITTNLDLTQMEDDHVFGHVWKLQVSNFDVSLDHLNKLHKCFPKVNFFCIDSKTPSGLTDDEKNHVNQVFTVGIKQTCTHF